MVLAIPLRRQGCAALSGHCFQRAVSASSGSVAPHRCYRANRCGWRSLAVDQVRGYWGEAAESEPRLSPQEERLLQAAKPRSDDILRRHFAPPDPTKIPRSSLSGTGESSASEVDWDNIRRKRLIYRSKQRGWLEVDLLLGTWASENVPHLSPTELDEFEAFVNLETIDIYNVITLRIAIPEEIRSGTVERIQQWARDSPLGKADPAAYEKVKKGSNLI